MPIYSPTGFLDITNATLRTSNLEAQNIKLNGGNIYVTSELTTDELLNLDNVVNAGNATSNTVQFTNVTTGLVADSNIVVTGNVTAGSFLGDGSGLTSIPPSAITGTLSQWSDGANGDVYIASNVGIGNVHTLTSNTLQVGANLYVRDADANVLTVTGNVAADYFEGDGSKLTGISSTLQAITDSGNVTSNTVQFSNATTGFVTTSNIEVGGALKINTITAAAYHSLQAVTNVGNVTSNTVQFSNATTGLVTTANVEVGGELTVSGNVSVDTDTLFVDTATSRVGVGTGTPEATLHVEGNVYVSSNLEVDGSTISTTIVSDGVPNISWAKSIGGTSTDSGYGIATDSGGNVYVTGEYRGTADFGSGTSLTSAGSDDVYVAKYDTSGTVQWAKSIGGTSSNFGYDIATDSSGNVYVTGQYNGIVDFGPSTSLTSAGSGDAFVAKYDTNGTVRWATSIGGTSSNFGYGIATDSSGNVYVTGHYNGIVDFGPSTSLTSAGSGDAFVAKYNTSGTVQWATSIGGTGYDTGNGIATDSSGNVYVTGRYNGTANFGPSTSLTGAGSGDAYVAKYDTSGTVQWAKSIGGTLYDIGYGIATDSGGNVYVTGDYRGTADFGSGTSLTSAGSGDVYVAKYDTSGTVQWARGIGGTVASVFGYGIATDSSGNVYVTGEYYGTADFGSGTSLTGAGISRDAFVAKYNTSGTVQWAKSIGGTATDSGQGIATDSSGNVYVTGRYNGTANFGSGTSLTSAGSTDVFIAKYSPPKNLNINKSVDIQGDVNMLHTSNTAALKINSNVVTEFPRSKKLIKYPRVALTGQTTSNYIVTGSSWYNSPALGGSGTQYEPWKAFDNVGSHPTGQLAWYSFDYPTTEAYSGTDNAFNPNHGGTATPDLFTGAVQGEWLKIQLPHKVALDHYIMYGPNQESEFPRDWTVYGSADGTNWVRVDDRVSQIFGAGTGGGGTATGKKKEYQLDTQTDEYLYFAFVFTRGSVNRTQYVGVGEIELFGVPEYDPEADGVDVTVKSLPNVPNTDWLEVYYDAKDLADGSTTVNDLKPVGTAINGTVAGNTSVTDGAFTFDGSGDYISGTLSSSATGDWVHSLSMWFKADSFSATSPHTLFYGGGTSISANNLIFLRVDGGDNPHIHYSDIGTAVQKNMSVFTDVWYHVTATYSGGGWANAKLYINGELTNDTLTDTTPLTLTGSSTFYIGKAINSFNPSFNGSIANFRLFNRALTSDEIYQLYAYQKEYFGHGDLSMTLKAGRLGIGTSEPKAALDVRGDIYGGCPIFFTAYAGANNTVTGSSTGTVIVFNKTTVNKGGAYDTSNGRCTFPVSGYYEVFFRGGTAGTADFHAKIYKNGNAPGSGGWPDNLPRLWDNGDTQYRNAGTIQFFYYFTAGEYIEVRLTNSSVFNADNYNSFSVKYLSN